MTPRNRGLRWSSPKQADRGRPGRMIYLPRDLHAALLELARRVPPEVGFSDGREKAALRDAVRGLMPEAIRTRPKSALPKDQNVAGLYARELLRLAATDATPGNMPHPGGSG